MTKKKILITHNIPLCTFDHWDDYFEVDMPEDSYSYNDILERLYNADYLINCHHYIDEKLLCNAPNLIAINSYGAGYDSIDLDACRERCIFVTNSPNAVTESTAEMAMGLLLSLSRRITQCDARIRSKQIQWGILKNSGISLVGKSVGIIGLGRIGKAFARRANAMGMKVFYYNRRPLDPNVEKDLQVSYLPLRELYQSMDIVSLHMPYSSENHHLIDIEALSMMKPEALIINTARGKLIDEDALVIALKNKLIGGAGLDVYENEPLINQGLIEADNTVLTPHAGAETYEVCLLLFQEAINGFMQIEVGRMPDNNVLQ